MSGGVGGITGATLLSSPDRDASPHSKKEKSLTAAHQTNVEVVEVGLKVAIINMAKGP